jgi:hypothetical protein
MKPMMFLSKWISRSRRSSRIPGDLFYRVFSKNAAEESLGEMRRPILSVRIHSSYFLDL